VPITSAGFRRQQRLALALLAVANIKPNSLWSDAAYFEDEKSWALTTREIIKFWNEHYGERLSSGSYDDVRRKDLVILVEADLVLRSAGKPNASTNNPQRRYAISPDAKNLLRRFGTNKWQSEVEKYINRFGRLADQMERRRQQVKIPVQLPNGKALHLSAGPHNQIQKAIIEEFLPRFVPGAEVLYLGDAVKKILFINEGRLKELGFFELAHDVLPDIVAYDPQRNCIFLIEAVYSSNPVSKLRHRNLERLTKRCSVPRIYVSALESRSNLRYWLSEISWETEVWLLESPDHLIHFDGNRFLEPYVSQL
jgi:hypothetical protein